MAEHTTMLERCALAILTEELKDFTRDPRVIREVFDAESRDRCMKTARCAIEAIRSPEPHGAFPQFTAMIDAILTETS